MSKDHLFRVSFFTCVAVLVVMALGSCLNPISFDESMLPTIKVDISGTIKIDDVAVLWLVNRTKNVQVKEFTIDRPKADNEAAEDYIYPITTKDKPGPGESLAAYHSPTDAVYTMSIVYENTTTNAIDVLGPLNVQFPRAADYRYYLYWTTNGELVLVNEDRMQELPADPDANYPPVDPPSSANAHTLVVINVTPDQAIDVVEFEKNGANPSVHQLQNRPRAKDQARILLGTGSYDTRAYYTKNNISLATNVKTTIIIDESSSQAVRTNYLYFYKSTSGYALSPFWPPIPNDAVEGNSILDTLNDNQGILEIVNGADGNDDLDIIHKIMIGNNEYKADPLYPEAPYMLPGFKKQYILDTGTALVSFKPRNNPYGFLIPRTIEAKKITQLVYTRGYASPDLPSPNSGIIRITNNSSAVVSSVKVHNLSDTANPLTVTSGEFAPPYPIQYGQIGRVYVDGAEFPLDSGVGQVIQVILDTPDDTMAVNTLKVLQLAALKGRIVDIVINESSLNPGGGNENARIGSKVTVVNSTITPSTIGTMQVYNTADAGSSGMYPLALEKGGSKELYVYHSPEFPIVDGGVYKARLYVITSEGLGYLEKEFVADGKLYSKSPDSHPRTITLTEQDLIDAGLAASFIPVTNVKATQDEFTVYTKANAVIEPVSSFQLKTYTVVEPDDATNKTRSWSENSEYITVDANGVLKVVKYEPNGTEVPVIVTVTVKDGAGTLGSEVDYTQDITFKLKYVDVGGAPSSMPLQAITLFPVAAEITYKVGESSQTYDIDDLLTLQLNPLSPHINDTPITAADLTWTASPSSHATISNGKLTLQGVPNPAEITIYATLPAAKNGTGGTITSNSITLEVKAKIVSVWPW